MTNNSPFALNVNFSFFGGGVGVHRVLPLPGAPPKVAVEGEEVAVVEESTRGADAKPVFFLADSSITLAPEETRDVRVSAFPGRVAVEWLRHPLPSKAQPHPYPHRYPYPYPPHPIPK